MYQLVGREVTNGAFPWPQTILLKQLEEWHVIASCDQLGETLRAAPILQIKWSIYALYRGHNYNTTFLFGFCKQHKYPEVWFCFHQIFPSSNYSTRNVKGKYAIINWITVKKKIIISFWLRPVGKTNFWIIVCPQKKWSSNGTSVRFYNNAEKVVTTFWYNICWKSMLRLFNTLSQPNFNSQLVFTILFGKRKEFIPQKQGELSRNVFSRR